MNVLDYVFIGLVLVGVVRGVLVGLSRQLFGLFMVIVAVWVAGRFYPALATTLSAGERMEARTADIAAYVLILAGVCIAFLLTRLLLRALIKFGFTPIIERLGGAVVGGLMGALSASAAMVALSLIPHDAIHTAVTQESAVGRRLNQAFPAFYKRMAERYNLPAINDLDKDSEDDTEPAPVQDVMGVPPMESPSDGPAVPPAGS